MDLPHCVLIVVVEWIAFEKKLNEHIAKGANIKLLSIDKCSSECLLWTGKELIKKHSCVLGLRHGCTAEV